MAATFKLARRPNTVASCGTGCFAVGGRPVEGHKPLVICGPSGVGKGTIIKRLFDKYPSHLGFSVSHTTRAPRPGEEDGVHYHFAATADMAAAVARGDFIEHAEVHGNRYGTSFAAVAAVAHAGRVPVLDIDMAGVAAIRHAALLDPHYVFIAPPDMAQLEARLRGRATEREEDVVKRLAAARAEVDYGTQPGNFDAVVVNADLEAAVAQLCAELARWYPWLGAAAERCDG
ncbi:guanylate kinase [Tribonema minus]|uniref:guanylate kinase n=1 Tax=Tribonema minus TaxID=303371 RepID=A0A835ZDV7_9STRA|nr:guanylate kinase [Tribonema minus]